MTLHILGAGSVGLLYATNMRKIVSTGDNLLYPVVLLLRKAHKRKLFRSVDGDKDELYTKTKLTSINGSSHYIDIPSEIIGENREKNINSILVTTKAFQAVSALEAIIPRIDKSKQTNIIIMSNGCLGISCALHKVISLNEIPNVNILTASCTHGVGPPDEHVNNNDDINLRSHIVHKGVGKTFLQHSAISIELHDLWNSCGLECKLLTPTEMYIMNWKKLVTNCVINPLTALRRCKNGALVQDVSNLHGSWNADFYDYNHSSFADRILREVTLVAQSEARLYPGINQNDLDQLSLDKMRTFVKDVVVDTKDNTSSMLVDVMNDRETEIHFLNGYVVGTGRKHGIDIKANEYIVNEIEKLRIQNLS